MQIQINAPNVTPDDFQTKAEQGVQDALATYADKLTRVEVHVQDLNGQKGGVDKRCLIEARPRGLDPVTAEHEGTQAHEALKGALDKLGRVLSRRFGKLGAREH